MFARTLLRTALTVSLLAFAPTAFGQDDPLMGGGSGGMTPTGTEKPAGQTGQMGQIKVIKADQAMFKAAPNFLPIGAEVATLQGDPAGPTFTGMLRVPDNWTMPANTSASELHLTVLDGSVRVMPGRQAMGATGGTTPSGTMPGGTTPSGTTPGGTMGGSGMSGQTAQGGAQLVNEGSVVIIPANQAFSLMADEASVLQVHSMGAWNPQYVNANEDPRKGARPSTTQPVSPRK